MIIIQKLSRYKYDREFHPSGNPIGPFASQEAAETYLTGPHMTSKTWKVGEGVYQQDDGGDTEYRYEIKPLDAP
jgi:hypothetical protein